ncbi:MAG: hypothetical protein LAO09_03555 [Acidobacteriia bacterium]|nr:hypothetical protein [Terriglobia bacterium]
MLRRYVLLARAIVLSFVCGVAPAQQPPPPAQTTQDGCKSYYTLELLDQSVLQLLGTPLAPSNQALFPSPSWQQLQEWDFPSKVTAWSERPGPEEVAKRRRELVAASTAGRGDKSKNTSAPPRVSRPYELLPFLEKDYRDLEKWLTKEGPKKLPGMCVDQGKAGYILAVGVIADRNGATSPDNAIAQSQYDQSLTHQSDRSVGPNAATVSPSGGDRPADALSRLDAGSSRPGVYTCTYWYRTNGPGGAHREAPDYYYCHSGDNIPKSVVTAMLKYLAKNHLP